MGWAVLKFPYKILEGLLVLRAGFEPANPCGKGFPIRGARPAGQTLILSPSPLTWLGYRSPLQYQNGWLLTY